MMDPTDLPGDGFPPLAYLRVPLVDRLELIVAKAYEEFPDPVATRATLDRSTSLIRMIEAIIEARS